MDKPPQHFRLPAEWEPHRATLLTWPHNPTDWPGRTRQTAAAYGEIIRVLSRFEPVWLLCESDEAAEQIAIRLQEFQVDMQAVRLIPLSTNRSWIRDYGPITVTDQTERFHHLDFRFTGWARYPRHELDNRIPQEIARLTTLPCREVTLQGKPVVLEGGSIDTNGRGTLLTTRECLLSTRRQQRNAHLNQADLESLFSHLFGTPQVIWLNRGIEGDDTHGHVDDITRFVAPTRILTMVETKQADPNHAALQENLEQLREETSFEILPLAMPAPVFYRGFRLPLSYANFYIANGCVLVPTFNDPQDRIALGLLADCFPDREVIGIHAVDILTGLGGLHCISMQIPGKAE